MKIADCSPWLICSYEPHGSVYSEQGWRSQEEIEPGGSIRNNVPMGRTKNFSREGVLKKTPPVFWKYGFADTSLQELEKATGNVEAENPAMKPTILAEMILTFFTGISMEQNLNVSKASMNRKVGDFMKVVRKL